MKRKWDPSIYRKTANIQHTLAQSLIENYLQLHGSEKILDVGCGDGFITDQLAALVPEGKVCGIDPSKEMIGAASETYMRDNLNFTQLNAQSINDNSIYDIVVSFSALQWVAEQLDVLKAFNRSLKSGGVCLILFWPWTEFYWTPANWVSKSDKWAKRFENFNSHYYNFDVDGYRILLELAGFQINTLRNVEHDIRYKTVSEYADVIRSFLPHLAYLNEGEERESFLIDVCNQYHQFVGRDDKGCLFGTTRHIEVFATKK